MYRKQLNRGIIRHPKLQPGEVILIRTEHVRDEVVDVRHAGI